MSNYTNTGIQYDSSSTTTVADYIGYFVQGGDILTRYAHTEITYQASHNGSWYAGDTYQEDLSSSGAVIGDSFRDNSGTAWYYSFNRVYNSYHALSGGSSSDYEETDYGRDGNIYLKDINPAGQTIATAEYNSSDALVARNNWAGDSASINHNAQGVNTSSGPDIVYFFATSNSKSNPSVENSASGAVSSSLQPSDLTSDFTKSAAVSAPSNLSQYADSTAARFHLLGSSNAEVLIHTSDQPYGDNAALHNGSSQHSFY